MAVCALKHVTRIVLNYSCLQPQPRVKLRRMFGTSETLSSVCRPPLFQHNVGKRLVFTGNTASRKSATTKWQRLRSSPAMRLMRWTPIPLSIGFAVVAYQHYRHVRTREEDKVGDREPHLATKLELSFYRLVPLRTVSRLWGWLNSLDLPPWARRPLIGLYVRSFGCNLEEAEDGNLDNYRNLGEFFRRALKPQARMIHPGDCLVSPTDGTIMTFGSVDRCLLEQVKGVTYTLDSFLGTNSWVSESDDKQPGQCSRTHYHRSLLMNPKDNDLFHYVVYLAPGDYHRFHSPADWEVIFRRHFTGDLLSVQPGIARWIPGLFTLNERAVYVGRWKHGFFAFAAVGATNVGSIRVHVDKDLQTNVKRCKKGSQRDFSFTSSLGGAARVCKGELFGEFNLGSTIVLVFEAPRDFRFQVREGQRVRVGEALNVCEDKRHVAVEKAARFETAAS